jgi:hypothetical protein
MLLAREAAKHLQIVILLSNAEVEVPGYKC